VNEIARQLGIEALRGAMATLLGVPIDRYVQVDMDDFASIVDAVGGVDVEVETRLSDPKVNLFLEPGPAHLDGVQALGFSRTRVDSDYGRAGRQQQVIIALVRKWLDAVIAGDGDDPLAVALRRAAGAGYQPDLVIAPLATDDGIPTWPIFEGKTARDGRATAYVCRGYACDEPTSDPERVRAQVAGLA